MGRCLYGLHFDSTYWFFSVIVTVNKKYFTFSYSQWNFSVTVNGFDLLPLMVISVTVNLNYTDRLNNQNTWIKVTGSRSQELKNMVCKLNTQMLQLKVDVVIINVNWRCAVCSGWGNRPSDPGRYMKWVAEIFVADNLQCIYVYKHVAA